jgi:hypothetical protein
MTEFIVKGTKKPTIKQVYLFSSYVYGGRQKPAVPIASEAILKGVDDAVK